MHPGGVAQGVRALKDRKYGDIVRDVERVVNPSSCMTAVERLNVYARAYYQRLVECLQAEFPVLRFATGQDLFEELANRYLEEYPSRSYTLGRLGMHLGRYLGQLRHDAAADKGFAGWLEFLAELARFEWTVAEIFDGPGVERTPLLNVAKVLQTSKDRWPNIRIVCAPCLRLLSLRYPVHRYHTEAREGRIPEIPQRSISYLAMFRRDYVVRHLPIRRLQYRLLSCLIDGKSIGQAIENVVTGDKPQRELAVRVGQWAHEWASLGFFISLET
jgi:hypothetical protein